MGVADTGPTLATSMHDAAPRSFPSRFSSPLPTTAPPSSCPFPFLGLGRGGGKGRTLLTLDLASNTSTSVGDNYIFVILYSIRCSHEEGRDLIVALFYFYFFLLLSFRVIRVRSMRYFF